MRFKKHLKLEHGLRQIDIAPLVDMVFLLLIFFMLTSTFIVQPAIKVKLPRAVTSDVTKQRNLEIVVTRGGLIYLNGKVRPLGELKSVLRGLSGEKPSVLIKADRGSRLGKVVEIWDICRSAGIRRINIATIQE
jgi:biopolymer transport protein ExbD